MHISIIFHVVAASFTIFLLLLASLENISKLYTNIWIYVYIYLLFLGFLHSGHIFVLPSLVPNGSCFFFSLTYYLAPFWSHPPHQKYIRMYVSTFPRRVTSTTLSIYEEILTSCYIHILLFSFWWFFLWLSISGYASLVGAPNIRAQWILGLFC